MREQKKKSKRKIGEWCIENPLSLPNIYKKSRIKCPKCKKRFWTRTEWCGDINRDKTKCLHFYIPAHKIK